MKRLVDQMYRIINSWTGFDKDPKDLKNILRKNLYPLKMTDHITKSYLNDKINCRNEWSSQNTESEIKITYFQLPFIGTHSKLTRKYFAIVWRFNWFLEVRNCDVLFHQKIHIKVNTFLMLSISLFVLALMLVMSTRLADIWQTE